MKPAARMVASAEAAAQKRAAEIGRAVTATEIVAQRTMRSKLFDLGDGVRHLSTRLAPAHFRADPANTAEPWGEVDTDIQDLGGGQWGVRDTFYEVTFDSTPGYSYRSKRGPDVRCRLFRVGNAAPNLANVVVEVDGDRLWWRNVAPGLDMYALCRPGYVEIFKVLADASAPRSYTWTVQEIIDDTDGRPAQFRRQTAGTDAAKDRLEITTDVTARPNPAPGRREFRYRETWTGRVSRIVDRQTRQRAWFNDPVYPVLVDTAITENIVAGGDDGHQSVFGWSSGFPTHELGQYIWAFGHYHPGHRFQTVAIDNAATITAATITVNVVTVGGNPGTGIIYGDDVDDAAAWSGSTAVTGITKTTASKSVSVGATGFYAADVASIVQEIVNRGGWASGNDMRFGWISNVPGTGYYADFEDYTNAGTDEAQLDVTFTAGGGSGQPTAKRFGGVPFMGGHGAGIHSAIRRW